MIKFMKKELDKVAKFLLDIELTGVENIHRMRVVNQLKKQHEEMVSEEIELLKAHAEVDTNGELVRTEAGGFQLKDQNAAIEFRTQQEKLLNEQFVMADSNLNQALGTLEHVVMNLDKKLSNEEAETHFMIAEAFEEAKLNQNKQGDDE
ncbi:hypothetical protein [Shouchella lehensis]|uniref:DUF1617 family protein n=1 Tax=Shouchella lehensis TaxID=300825 RepID=A0A4Y7WIG4_9BACI|nr:hypothetical protein [Shouchella lehensis]MBG9785459.1 hypothetical protein [Shouchella lehensis]TES47895.1 hypothetical protein E2L03_12185 [Shouchella lehensis]